jgi:hypothetical protein
MAVLLDAVVDRMAILLVAAVVIACLSSSWMLLSIAWLSSWMLLSIAWLFSS